MTALTDLNRLLFLNSECEIVRQICHRTLEEVKGDTGVSVFFSKNKGYFVTPIAWKICLK